MDRRVGALIAALVLALTIAGPVAAAKFEISASLAPIDVCEMATTATWSGIPLNARTWTFNWTTNGVVTQNIATGTVPARGGTSSGAGLIFGTGLLGSRIDFMDSHGRVVYSKSSNSLQVNCVF